jgi:Ca2+-binding RTX toxin-like protein
MAIKINVFDANTDGTGIDVDAYFLDFKTNYTPDGFGYFSNDSQDFSGPQYANTEQSNLISNAAKQSVVFDAGSGADKIEYTSSPQFIIGGDLASVSFGYGLSYSKGTDSFTQATVDLQISGIGYIDEYGPTNPVRDLINATRSPADQFSAFTDFFNTNDIEFTGSSGKDAFTGYAKNDTLIGGDGDDTLSGGGGNDQLYGGDGNDTLKGDAGNDTFYYDGKGTDVVAAGFVAGAASEDVIKITGFTDYASIIAATTDDNGDAVIDFGGGNTLRITGVEKADLHEDDFAFGAFGAPNVSDDAGSTVKDTNTVIDVLANDTDIDGTIDPTTVAIVDGPDNGSVLIDTLTGKITYTPTTGYAGTDTFTYTVKDNNGNVSGEATVTIDVASTHILTSGDDVFSGDSLGLTKSGIWVNGGNGHDYLVTSNGASHPDKVDGGDGNDLIFVGKSDDYVDGGAGNDVIHGRAGIDTLIGGTGDDTFVVRMTDAGTTTITDNDGTLFHGTFRPASYPASWGTPPATSGFVIAGTATFVSTGVYSLSVNGGTQTFVLNWTGGDLTITEAGKSQTVVIEDYDNGTFGLLLPAPDANDDVGSTVKDTNTVIDVLANDTDIDGTIDPTTVAIVDGPDNGSVLIDTLTGKITYTPTTGYSGKDTFTYTVEDNDGNISGEATVTIDVASTHILTSGDDVFSGDSLGLTKSGIWVNGGAGHDYLVTSNSKSQPDKVDGGDGNDLIFVGPSDDYVDGGAGNDVIHGRSGIDTLIGGAGNDTFVVRMTDAGTTTITDTDGMLWHGTYRPASYPASWSPLPPATTGFSIEGTATLVSPGVYNLLVNGGTQTFVLNWTGGDLTITEAGKSQTVVVEDYVNGMFGITLGAGVTINGTAGKDTINGTTTPAGQPVATNLSDTIFGNDGNDNINALGGNDEITGGKGNDVLSGGDGNDTFLVEGTDGQGDTYNGGAGIDTIKATGTGPTTFAGFKIDNSIERLVGNGGAILGTAGNDVFDFTNLISVSGITYFDGGAGNDKFVAANSYNGDYRGGAGNDTFTGGNGNDTFEGGAGVDTLNGGEGNDTLVVSGANDVSDVLNGGNGTDTIKVTGTTAVTLTNFKATVQSIETWTGNGESLLGTAANNTFDLSGLTTVTGLTTIDAGAGNDTLIASNLVGMTLTGGAGVDTVTGGAKDDTVVISGANDTSDKISGGAGTNTIEVRGSTAVTLGGFDAGAQSFSKWVGNNQAVLGTAAANTFDFADLTDVAGITFVDSGAGNDIIIGTDGYNWDLRGGTGDDVLTGGDGNDTFLGGAGADIITGNAGTDTVSYANSSKGVTVNLRTGFATGGDATGDKVAGIENAIGSKANDMLTAASAGSVLDGGAGVDALLGGVGDDTFIISGTNDISDVRDGNDGTDTVKIAGGNATLNGFVGAYEDVEIFNGGGFALLGTTAANIFDFTGVDVTNLLSVDGGAGNDTLTAGDDGLKLIGGAGVDTVTGGAGDDTIVISGTNDTTDAIDGGGGTNTIEVTGKTAVTLAGFNATTQSIDEWTGNNQALLGTTAANTFDLSGLSSVSGLTYVDGGAGNDVIIGSDNWAGDLRGGAGDDTLTAGDLGDILTGGAGKDTLTGGIGDDTFVISGKNDTTDVFAGGGGTDTLKATAAVTLNGLNTVTSSIEAWEGISAKVSITGTAANETFDLSNLDTVTNLAFVDGGAGNDTLIGSDNWAGTLRGGVGNDRIQGGSQVDTLSGGAGNDTFVFIDAAQGKDLFTDFANGDKLEIAKAAFAGGLEALPNGALLDATYLVVGVGAAADNATHGQFIYDTTTDILSWDADGTGGGAAVQIGQFNSTTLLKLADFTLA